MLRRVGSEKAHHLSKCAEAGAIRLALNIEDRALAERLTALLANVPGLRLVGAGETADVTLVHSTGVSAPADGDVLLTPPRAPD
jgi:hypothetical protein